MSRSCGRWTGEAPFDHDGDHYRVNGAFAHVRPQLDAGAPVSRGEAGIPVFWGGSSDPAIEHGAAIADVYAFPGFAADALHEPTRQVLARAASLGRKPDLLTSLKVLVAPTSAQAWERARALQAGLIDEVVDNGRFAALAGESREATRARAEQEINGEAMQGRLWHGIAKVPTGRPSLGCLVGSFDEVTEALLEYNALGITRFIVSGFDPLGDVRLFGSELIPRLKEAVLQNKALA